MPRILVIEDEELARYSMRDILESGGYEVVEASDGRHGIQVHEDRPADLVITDIIMPHKDGVETVIEMRRAFPDLPIIAVSAGGRARNLSFLTMAKEFGANECLVKPFAAADLLAAVERCLKI